MSLREWGCALGNVAGRALCVLKLKTFQPMLVSELVDDGNVGLEQRSFFPDGGLDEKGKAKVADTPAGDSVFLTILIRIICAYQYITNGIGFSNLGTHDNNVVL